MLEERYSNTYSLNLDLSILKDYDEEVEVLYKWAIKNKENDLTDFSYSVEFNLSSELYLDNKIRKLVEYKNKLGVPKNTVKVIADTIIFFCYRAETELLSTFFKETEFNELYVIARKLYVLSYKTLSNLTISQLPIEDIDISKKILKLASDMLLEKFVRCAKFTRYRYIQSIDDVLAFYEDHSKANEATHLQTLGYWASLIQQYLHNCKFMLSVDNTNLNINKRTKIPLTNDQSELIYNSFKYFNLLTPRKRENPNYNLYLRNCIKIFNQSLTR